MSSPDPIDREEPEETLGYIAPKQKSIDELQALDSDDESLVKYKQALLAGLSGSTDSDERNVIVQAMVLMVDGRDDAVLDLTGDLSKCKNTPFTVPEGATYTVGVLFRVQHAIVSGLRYYAKTSRKGVSVDKQSYMVGSYGPRAEPYLYTSPKEEFPKGMIARGHYRVKSKFIDDDKHVYLEWEWAFNIQKDA